MVASSVDYRWLLEDPLRIIAAAWPEVETYDKQQEIIYAVRDCPETFVPAGNMLGKDYITGLLCLCSFLWPNTFLKPRHQWSPFNDVRIITTSVADDHLDILWGEIGRFIQSCRIPLLAKQGGPLIWNHRHLRKMVNGKECKISYLKGIVAERGEKMAGHHASHTLGVVDEASGVDNYVWSQMGTWADRRLAIGNCNPCDARHFFRVGVEGGDLEVRESVLA